MHGATDIGDTWDDPRARDDRAAGHECPGCGAPVRWVHNLASSRGGMMPLVARAPTSARARDPHLCRGLVAVYADACGFTVGASTTADELHDAWLYQCHWDVCEHAATERDRWTRQRASVDADASELDGPALAAHHRYAAWRNEQAASLGAHPHDQ